MTSARATLERFLQGTGIQFTESRDEFEAMRGPAVLVRDPGVYSRILRHGNLGFGEAYMDEQCDVKDLYELYSRVMLSGASDALPRSLAEMVRLGLGRLLNRQRRGRAKKDTNAHYDLGNDFYRYMLGDVMSYTCGYWPRPEMSLEESNLALYELICQKLDLKPGMRILDVGCGWGAFLEYAARNHGVTGVGVNISEPQLEECRRACDGLPIEFLYQDCRYLDVEKYAGEFDRVVAIALINHIGYSNYDRFFRVLHAVLKDGGLMLVHGIANREPMFNNDAFMNQYIFPNAVCMSMSQLLEPAERYFALEDFQNIAGYYPKTLLAWHDNVQRHWDEIRKLGFDTRFRRMWELYLVGSAACTNAQLVLLFQAVLRKGLGTPLYTGAR